MLNFCTLFDSIYLSRGLILYESIREHTDDFHIYIFAFDELALKILLELKLDHATIISLDEFENKELLEVKKIRTRGEYCWTSTSSVIEYVFEKFNVTSCTYIDADICFFGSPAVLLDEMPKSKSVLITEHRFSKIAQMFEMKRAGRFCVQFISFNNTEEGRAILKKWIGQCIDWCYARYEDGKFGDQKYLDTWPDEYPGVYILEHPGGGLAPWNVNKYRFIMKEDEIFGIEPKTNASFEIIFFHFHYVRIFLDGYADLGWNRIKPDIIEKFYKPYIQMILEKEKSLEESFSYFKSTYIHERPGGVKETMKYIFKKITRYNFIKFLSY